jgi:hypothetical protein
MHGEKRCILFHQNEVCMFRKLKEMFGKEEQPPLNIAFADINGWLEHEAGTIRDTEEKKVSASRKQVLLAIETLRELVTNLGSGDHEGTGIPKLEKVAENSLPLYKKAMLSALSRQFPGKPEDFYHAVAECLKGCLKSSQGPGRYLIRVFPGEMKSIQSSIAQVGREVNAMNPVFAESGKKRYALENIRTLHTSVRRMISEQGEAELEYPEILGQCGVLAEETVQLADRITHLNHDPSMNVFKELTNEEHNLSDEQARLTAEIISLGGIIVHVMRRAEKVAQKNRKDPVVKKIHLLVDLLSKNEIPLKDDVLPLLLEVLPSVNGMVAAGDIALRNKEEERYFNDPRALPSRVDEIYQRIGNINRDIAEIRRKLGENTFIREKESLEKHYKFKKAELAEKERKADDLRQRIEACKRQTPELISHLEASLAEYTGQTIILSFP